MSDDELTIIDTPEDSVDILKKLESGHKSKLVFDSNKTAYIMEHTDTDVPDHHTFDVYDTATKKHTQYGRFAKRIYSDPVPLKDYAGYVISPGTGKREFYSLNEVLEIYPDRFIVKLSNDATFLVNSFDNHLIVGPVYTTLRSESLKHSYSMRLNGLSQVRSKGGFDFNLVTKDEDVVPVHSLILRSNWPFFDAMMESQMTESRDNRLEVPYPRSWVEAMVSYFYGEPFDVKFPEATGLLILSDVYDIPELQRLAITKIRAETLDMHKCLAGWKNAFEAQNVDMRSYFATFARKNWETLEESAEFLQQLTQQQAVELMLDVSRACVDGLAL